MKNPLDQKSLYKIFNECVAQATHLRSDVMKDFLVVNTDRKIIYQSLKLEKTFEHYLDGISSQDILKEITADLSKEMADDPIKEVIKDILKGIVDCEIKRMKDNGGIAKIVTGIPLVKDNIKVLLIDEQRPFLEEESYIKEISLVDSLNHELGHVLIEGGMSSGKTLEKEHLAECIAEAYKSLRHKQLFGNREAFLEKNVTSHNIVFAESPKHYCDAVHQKVEELSIELEEEGFSFSHLSDEETLTLAKEIAIKYSFTVETLNRVHQVYKPVIKASKEEDGCALGEATIDKTISVIIENQQDYDVYRAGKIFLDCGDVSGVVPSFDRSKWNEISKKIEKEHNIETSLAKVRDAELGDDAITVDTIKAIITNRISVSQPIPPKLC